MNTFQSALIALLIVVFAFAITRQILIPWISRTPVNIGVKDGRFAPCKKTPNCVSTQADPMDEQHYIAPIKYSSTQAMAKKRILEAIQNTGGTTKVITQKPDYIHAENQSPVMKYIDDIEIYFNDRRKEIHIKSASRIGYSDMGMNRKRVEKIRKSFKR